MAATAFPRFTDLVVEIQRMVWEEAALQTRDGARVYSFDLIAQSYQYIPHASRGAVVHTEVRGPILAARPELRDDTKDQRALLMTCRDSRLAFLQFNPNRINFTRAPRANEVVNYSDPRIQFPLYFNADVDIICLPADHVRRVHLATPGSVLGQMRVYSMDNLETNWPVWFDFENIAIDITDHQVSLHILRKGMVWELYDAIGNILYGHPASVQPNLRLFVANFGPVQYDEDGLPIGMTIDANAPAYDSASMIANNAGLQDALSVDDMWVLLDEALCVKSPGWSWTDWNRGPPLGRSPRLLVPAQDGQRLLCVQSVVVPPYQPDAQDSEGDHRAFLFGEDNSEFGDDE